MKYIILSITLILLHGCASVQSLTGGEKDSQPPRVIQTSIDNAETSVTSNSISFSFDEYIALNNPKELLLISPNQKKPPTLTIKGKRLTIKLNDSLLENTTYTLNFNGSVMDINESNKLENYNFIFSTADYIDSSFIQGFVHDITTNTPCTDCYVYLYSVGAPDSSIFKSKPNYLAKTNPDGSYFIKNLPSLAFKEIAIRDNNKNLTLDDNEYVSLAKLTHSDSSTSDSLSIFPVNLNKYYNPKLVNNKIPGYLAVAFSKPIDINKTTITLNEKISKYTVSYTQDTIYINLVPTTDTTIVTITTPSDTTSILYILTLNTLNYKLNLTTELIQNKVITTSKTPINTIDKEGINLYLDSTDIVYDSITQDLYSFTIHYPSKYLPTHVKYKANTITDLFNKTNSEEIKQLSQPINYNSNLILDIQIDSGSYILELYQSNTLYKHFYLTESKKLIFNNLPPNTYMFKLIADANLNLRWDTGDYINKLSPEYIQFTAPFDIRENWDKELIINALYPY